MNDDPGPVRRGAAEWLEAVKQCEREQELFRAYDLAEQGLAEHPDDLPLKHRAVLSLARAEATELARRKFDACGFDAAALAQEEIATLDARLLKDAALAAGGAERRRQAARAAKRYGEIYRRTGGYYPGINAATLQLLAGHAKAAAALGRRILGELGAIPGAGDAYYRLATRIEALLLTGDLAAAEALIAPAVAANRGDYAALATTWKQLRLVLAERGLDAGRFAADFAPPRVMHFVGHVIAAPGAEGRFTAADEARVRDRIAEHLEAARIGFGFGSLASGADILFVEALRRRGAGVTVVLPFARDDFVRESVAPSGKAWVRRFDDCLADPAVNLVYANEEPSLNDDRLFAYCSRLAMGLAVLRARHLGVAVEQVAVWDGEPPSGIAGTAADIASWRRTGRPQTIIAPRRADKAKATPAPAAAAAAAGEPLARAMLFCDVRGFSRLSDTDLPHFFDGFLGTLAGTVDRYRDAIGYLNTWGDGLFLVFEDAGQAAHCALDLQHAITDLDLEAAGLPTHLALRVGGHYGPVHPAWDPILKKTNYVGAHVTRAARIEPVTPEGCVYVTETFAAVLALEHADRFACDYVGMTQSAKQYGAMRMFLLRRRGAG